MIISKYIFNYSIHQEKKNPIDPIMENYNKTISNDKIPANLLPTITPEVIRLNLKNYNFYYSKLFINFRKIEYIVK